ncbi:LacI family DNA-binding transcriptional regulator [Propioniciclava soli]|uniref:LacI family DNA-binding transcriptional regulator n=1 Tax=Propioniciclava soli TaxID=2775081 RepID=UPI001E4AA7DF|nr:LacI family DNA-binding transcriptional regulator [Propioniciclava soli]
MTQERTALPPRRPTMTDVANAAGVSKGAVSKVIRDAYGVSPAMRARVEKAIAQLGYRPRVAARVMRGQSFTIGLETPHLGQELQTLVVEGAAEQLAGSPYQLVIVPGLGRLSATEILESLVDRQVDGIIAIASDMPTEAIETLAQHTPMVVLGRHSRPQAFDTVVSDDAAGADLVMDHLLGLGHTRITHLTIDPPTAEAPHVFRRDRYVERMRAAGLRPVVEYAPSTERGAVAATSRLLGSDDPPTAIFAGHDAMALNVLRAAADLGLGASDLSVVGYDNIELAGHPLVSLTTVDHRGTDVGRVAISLLLERINGRTEARHECFSPALRVRRSTAAPR